MSKFVSSKTLILAVILVAAAGIILVYNKTKKTSNVTPYQPANQVLQTSKAGLSPAPTITRQNADQVLLQTQTNIQTTMDNMNTNLNNLDTYSIQANNNEGF